jgi:hypothetical protein
MDLQALPAEEAASRAGGHYGVPRDLLLALAWHSSAFHISSPDDDVPAAPEGGWQPGERVDPHVPSDAADLAGAEHGPPAWGWMGLSDERVALAARLTGYSADEIRFSREANLLAGAAVLRTLSAGQGVAEPDPSVPGATWFPALVAWAGYDEEWMSHEFAVEVYTTLQEGLAVESEEGDPVEIPEWELPDLEDLETLEAPGEDSGDFHGGGAVGYPGRARYYPASSSNYDYRPGGSSAIRRVVMHTTEGSYNGAIGWFRNPSASVSAHYVVRRSDGQVTQMVPDNYRAWHACGNNSDTIGVEQEGSSYNKHNWTPALLDGSARLVGWLVKRYGIPVDRNHIVGHGEIQPGYCAYRSDPGKYFPWGLFLKKVRAYRNGSAQPGTSWVKFIHPDSGEVIGNPALFRLSGKSDVRRMSLWRGAKKIKGNIRANPANVIHSFGKAGKKTVKVKAYGRHGALIASKTVTFRVRDTQDLDPIASKVHRRTYSFRPGDTPSNVHYVRYWADSKRIRDEHTNSFRTFGPDFLAVDTFEESGRRLLMARGYRSDGKLVAQGYKWFRVTKSAGPHGANRAHERYEDTGDLVATTGQGIAGTTVRLTSSAMPGSGAAHVRYYQGNDRLEDIETGADFANPADFALWYAFDEPGATTIKTKVYDADWNHIDNVSTTVHVPSPDLVVDWDRQGAMDYRFDADAPAGSARVVIEIDGWALPDEESGDSYAPAPGFYLDYEFNYGGWRELHAVAKDGNGNVLDTFDAEIYVH